MPAPKKTPEQFWSKVDIKNSDECWNWLGSKKKGKWPYGKVCYHGKHWVASRLAFVLTNGPIQDESLFVCHKCDNPSCCNPSHLYLGTAKDNTDDAMRKGRLKLDVLKPFALAGERAKNARFSNEKAEHVRYLYKSGLYTIEKLAAMYEVGITTIHQIVTNKTYKVD